MKRAIGLAALGVTTMVGALLVWEIREAVLLFLLALATAAAVRPVVNALVARGISRGLALLGTYTFALGLASTATYFFGVELGSELQRAGDQFLIGYERMRESYVRSSGIFGRVGALLPTIDALRIGPDGLSAVAGNAVDMTLGLVGLLAEIVLVLVLALYWDTYRDESLHFWIGLMRPERRRHAREIWLATMSNVGAQLRHDVGHSLITLGLCSLAFRGMGLTYWLLPSVAAAIARLFPFVGVVVGIAAAALAGWVDGPGWAVATAAIAFCVHLLLQHALTRGLPRRSTNPVILIFAAMVLVSAYGALGLVLALMVTAALQPTLQSMIAVRPRGPEPTHDLVDLRERLEVLKAGTAANAAPEVRSLVSRLEALIAQVAPGPGGA